jgi:hypothetical protein
MEIFKLLGTIAIDATEAKKALDDTTEKAQETGQETEGAFSKIGRAAGTIGRVVMTAGAALGTAWIAAIEGTREYRTHLGMLDAAFATSGLSSEAARKTYSDLNAVLGDSAEATEAAQQLANLADNEKELSTWTDICTGIYAKMGDAIPLSELTASANETARSGILTGSLVDALVLAGHSETEFQEKLDACSNEQERQKLIMDTLNGTYKDASTQYKETNKDVLAANKAQEKLTHAFSELGRVGEPILTAIKTKVSEMVTAAVPHIESFIGKMKDLRTWIQNNGQTIKNWGAAIAAASVTVGTFLLILNWGKIMTAATKAIKGVRTAVALFNTTLLANPIGLVIALIAGLVAGFILLWKNNEGFRTFWINLWSKIKSVGASAISYIKGKFSDFKGALSTVRSTFDSIRKTISDKIESARESVRKAIDKIKGFFKFKWSLPKLKMPSFSLKGKFSLSPPSVPKISVKWNAAGAVFDQPTIFNTPLGLQGVGERGAEAVAPITVLQGYVAEAVRAENAAIIRTLIEQNRNMQDFLKRTIPQAVLLDSGALVGELTPAMDAQLNERLAHVRRGNTR